MHSNKQSKLKIDTSSWKPCLLDIRIICIENVTIHFLYTHMGCIRSKCNPTIYKILVTKHD